MTESPKPDDDLFDELAALGANVANMLRAAWASPERQRVRHDLEAALQDVAGTLSRAGAEFLASPTGQHLQAEMSRVREKIRAGGLEATAQQELLAVLKRLNEELTRAATKVNPTKGSDSDDAA